MQSLLYLTEEAAAHLRKGSLGMALKKHIVIQRFVRCFRLRSASCLCSPALSLAVKVMESHVSLHPSRYLMNGMTTSSTSTGINPTNDYMRYDPRQARCPLSVQMFRRYYPPEAAMSSQFAPISLCIMLEHSSDPRPRRRDGKSSDFEYFKHTLQRPHTMTKKE